MTQDESVQARKASFLASEDQALNDYGVGCYQDGLASAGQGGGLSQADVDAAVLKQKQEDEQKFDDLAAKEAMEADLINKLKAILFPPAA